MILGCLIIFRILISLETLSTSASSVILDFSNILTATFNNVKNHMNYLLSCKNVSAELYFAERPLANRFANNVMPYTLGLLLFLVCRTLFLSGRMLLILRLLLLRWLWDIESIFDIERWWHFSCHIPNWHIICICLLIRVVVAINIVRAIEFTYDLSKWVISEGILLFSVHVCLRLIIYWRFHNNYSF